MQWSEPNNWPCAFTSEIIISQNTVDTPANIPSYLNSSIDFVIKCELSPLHPSLYL